MVDEICLIGWRDDIGAYLIMQYPRKKLVINAQDVMQIYTAHRQNTLYPNFATIHYKGKKIASFFSGLKTTEYIAAPNFIVSLFLDESESPSIFKDLLPNVSATLLTKLFEVLPDILKQLNQVKGIIILTKEPDIGEFPILIYPDLKVSSKIKAKIFEAHYKSDKIEKKCVIDIDDTQYVSIFTGTEAEQFIVVPNLIVVFLLAKEANASSIKKKITQYATLLLSKISNLLSKALDECNEKIVELMIEDELKESPIITEKDFQQFSKVEDEPEILMETGSSDRTITQMHGNSESESSIDHILEHIKMKAQELENNDQTVNEEPAVSHSLKDLKAQIQSLQEELREKNEVIEKLNEQIADLKRILKEKEQTMKKLMLIVKSLRKYVSY